MSVYGPAAVLFAHVVLVPLFAGAAPLDRQPDDLYANYLRAYGYANYYGVHGGTVPPPHLTYKSESGDMVAAISRLQEYAHLDVTGRLDEATVRLMSAPRCGLPDYAAPPPSRMRRREKRSPRWKNGGKVITWRWDLRGSADLYRLSDRIVPHVPDELRAAFDTWSNGTALKFSAASQADIVVSFGRRDHGGCSYEFDGRGGVLAHAFYPDEYGAGGVGGDVHFDTDETWSAGRGREGDEDSKGFSLFHVAVHEIGHAIGLTHSEDSSSVMFPWYTSGVVDAVSPRLPAVDSASVRKLYADLYGDDEELPPRKEVPFTKCGLYGPYDDIAYVRGELFVVKDGIMWRWQGNHPVEPGKHRLNALLPDLPATGRVNAFHYDAGRKCFIVVMDDDLYEFAIGTNHPHLLRHLSVSSHIGITSYFGPIEAVFEWRAETFVLAGPYFYSIDALAMKVNYAGPIANKWPAGLTGEGGGYHAAFSYRGRSYFVRDDTFWEYDVESGEFLKSGGTVGEIVPGCNTENRLNRAGVDKSARGDGVSVKTSLAGELAIVSWALVMGGGR